jgi:nicotinic acid phosphoribosyltransferase
MNFNQYFTNSKHLQVAYKTWMSGTYQAPCAATIHYPTLSAAQHERLLAAIELLDFDIEQIVFLAQYNGFHESFLNFLQRWQPKYDLHIAPTETTIQGHNKAEIYTMVAFFEGFFENTILKITFFKPKRINDATKPAKKSSND